MHVHVMVPTCMYTCSRDLFDCLPRSLELFPKVLSVIEAQSVIRSERGKLGLCVIAKV